VWLLGDCTNLSLPIHLTTSVREGAPVKIVDDKFGWPGILLNFLFPLTTSRFMGVMKKY